MAKYQVLGNRILIDYTVERDKVTDWGFTIPTEQLEIPDQLFDVLEVGKTKLIKKGDKVRIKRFGVLKEFKDEDKMLAFLDEDSVVTVQRDDYEELL